MDIVSPAIRSRMMASIRSANTKPEMIVRKILHGKGFRYRLNAKVLDWKPDLVLPRYHVVIFVHGCFWHHHESCKYATVPDSNVEKWKNKFDTNTRRDSRIERTLLEAGWNVAVIWECWFKRKLDISWLFLWIKNPVPRYVSWPKISLDGLLSSAPGPA